MWSSHRLIAPFVVLAALGSCTNPLDGLPEHEIPELGGSGGAATTGTSGAATGGAATSGGTGADAPRAGAASGGAPGFGGASGGTPTGGFAGAGVASGGTSTDGANTGGTNTGIGGANVATGGTGAGGAGLGGANVTTGGTGGSAAPGGSGPGSGGAGTGTGTTSAFSAVSAIVVRSCATAQCHGGRRSPNLSAANLYTTLTSTAVTECGNDRLVTPGDPGNSALLSLVNGLCGELLMPADCEAAPCLTAADEATIRGWIAAGAAP